MCKKSLKFVASVILLLAISLNLISSAEAKSTQHFINSQPQLTEEQKKELDSVRQEVLNKKIKLIKKYVEFGVISSDKAKAIIDQMKQRENKWQEEQNTQQKKKPSQKKKK